MHTIDLPLAECDGCGLCKNTCSEDAIKMEYDAEGFLIPVIDRNKCAECGACVKVCSGRGSQAKNKNTPIRVMACQTKDHEWAVESTAGGFFPTLAQYIIEQGGSVYGTAYSDQMEAIVCKATTRDEIKRFNGSKYVQSNLTDAYSEIKEDLESGKTVLFSGTPCQNAAIKTYLENVNTEKLITIDVVCYGVPSPGLFRAFISTIEKRKHSRVIDFRFRDKHRNGWSHTTVITLQDSHGKVYKTEEKDHRKIPYYRMFGRRNCFRKSCYSCKYNTIDRITDFTTGNFWGIGKMTDVFNTYLGVSMVLINSEKGDELYRSISDRLLDREMTKEQAIKANDALVHTTEYPRERDDIYQWFQESGFSKTYRKYYGINYLKVLQRGMKRFFAKAVNKLKR